MHSSYALLPQNDGSPTEGVRVRKHEKSSKLQTSTRVSLYATIIISACLVIDTLAMLYFAIRLTTLNTPLRLENLPLRHTYSTLDFVYNGTGIKSDIQEPIINLPLAFAHVDQSHPRQVLRQSSEMWMSSDGPVPVGDRRLLFTPKISTILQLRVMDYGMENCSLAFNGPPSMPGSAMDTTQGIVRGSKGNFTELDVWTLVAPRKLDMSEISWNTKPRRQSHLGSLRASRGVLSQSSSFPCPASSYQTFEIGCSSADTQCHVDLIIPTADEIGLYMMQFPTV
ncbi:hypothetical protein HGRIS_006068 [Hohenbuehelia grisea]|uniref:Ubiquitin 3 binding protein But2 C-terminal domain-containing protein n=1 Tax=Hohenbuehelia grisea TaxID=104357 RepID=A0ABR3JYP3_9AGAR